MAFNVKAAFRRELDYAQSAESKGDFAVAKAHLERAHILGQRWYISHMESHYRMFRLALKQSDTKEVRGQIVRMIGAGPFHLAGWIPVGNTGGADVSPTLPMPIPAVSVVSSFVKETLLPLVMLPVMACQVCMLSLLVSMPCNVIFLAAVIVVMSML